MRPYPQVTALAASPRLKIVVTLRSSQQLERKEPKLQMRTDKNRKIMRILNKTFKKICLHINTCAWTHITVDASKNKEAFLILATQIRKFY